MKKEAKGGATPRKSITQDEATRNPVLKKPKMNKALKERNQPNSTI